jgi:hypothetical protein
LIDKNKNNTDEITGEISLQESHFEEAIDLVLRQNELKK